MMRKSRINLNGIACGLAVLWGGFVSTADGVAQDRPPFDRAQFMEMRSGGGFPTPPGDFRGFDRGRDSDRERGDRDRRDSRDRGGPPGFGSSSYGGSSYGGSSSSRPGSSTSSGGAPASTSAQQLRVTMQLQATYSEIDTDRDGQIGLYEWKKAKRPLSQFLPLDTNGDGFLTPRELERAGSMPMMASATPAAGAPVPSPTGSPASTPVVASVQPTTPAAAPVVSKLSEEDQTKADEAQAKSTFSLLDRNRDGVVSAEEMARSSRIRPLFEQAGLKFDSPMPSDQFVSHYVRIQKSKRT